MYFKTKIIPEIEKQFKNKIKYHWLNVDEEINYFNLTQIEKHYNLPEYEYPIIIFPDTIIGSLEIIKPNIKTFIAKNLKEKKYDIVDSNLKKLILNTKLSQQATANKQAIVEIVYFTNPKCKKCSRVENCLSYLKKKYPNQIKVFEYIDKKTDNLLLLQAFDDLYKIEQTKHLVTPAIFIGDSAYIGEKAQDIKIIKAVTFYLNNGGVKAKLDDAQELTKKSKSDIVYRFKNLGIFTIILFGLLDGVNPCAFTTIIFFISYLSFIGRRKKEMIIVGLSYSFAVFLTYFLIGLGVLEFLLYLQVFTLISKIIIGLTGLMAIILSVVSIYNFFKVKEGKETEIALQLPTKIKQKIHYIIRKYTNLRNLVIGSLLIGFFVSIFELACTGQVYLPTITFMVHHPIYKYKATLLLLLYNLMFIVPLLIIFALTLKGLTSEKLAKIWKNKLELIEVLIGFLFLILGIFLIYSVL